MAKTEKAAIELSFILHHTPLQMKNYPHFVGRKTEAWRVSKAGPDCRACTEVAKLRFKARPSSLKPYIFS